MCLECALGYAEQVTYYHYVRISHYEMYPAVYFKIALL
jgi:hypothetical protein